jgi:hypothetical protein
MCLTSLVCPSRFLLHTPVLTFRILIVLSHEQSTTYSVVHTKSVCPFKVNLHTPAVNSIVLNHHKIKERLPTCGAALMKRKEQMGPRFHLQYSYYDNIPTATWGNLRRTLLYHFVP